MKKKPKRRKPSPRWDHDITTPMTGRQVYRVLGIRNFRTLRKLRNLTPNYIPGLIRTEIHNCRRIRYNASDVYRMAINVDADGPDGGYRGPAYA